ncbi:bifunctional 2',3'-cyclic-nucleotide 2'-phosphodiesterase/3'-nucleotidase [uncultured Roseovarius sp.]|uniref:bifunctional 2',3'-cyclic-nucleotide 2'-phosphodiesterase/3'-nucleotidase n=1 Tax=uncultured Roseovarius sp. TaxID=293344 RepID=UPI00261E91AC|nr:bifunctional 2',3'-cyclic-nucleotide 2'-phosphodiesterase/3'-nucleotidase [uncultured Roseovarius sp.]
MCNTEQTCQPPVGTRLTVRLLQTTDVHGHLLPFDYFTNQPDRPWGLLRLATLIARAREQAGAAHCLLLDNGDFLQGTPLSDLTGQPGHGWTGPHPVIDAMNRLGYDAGALGNHEFNFGLDWLTETLSEARFPIVCANAITQRGAHATDDRPLMPPYSIIARELRDSNGKHHTLRVGILGLVPTQIMTWDNDRLAQRLYVRDMVDTARAWLPEIRAAGADIVVVMAHTGIDPGPDRPMMENAARAIARLPGVDALLAGHSHKCFPGPAHDGVEGADTTRGTLHGIPCVMAGFRGDHLGQLDLVLTRDIEGAWRVADHDAKLLSTASAPPCPALAAALEPAHAHTLTLTARKIGETTAPLHSYLAVLRNDPITQIVNDAQRRAMRHALSDGPHAHLPLLSASAPFKTGGRGGPTHFTDIPAGPLCLRNIVDLYGFPNTLCGLKVTGADLRDWLERAAIRFRQIVPGTQDQPLLDPSVPGHDFDVIDGLTYAIDLSQPPRYDLSGALINPDAHRIRDLRHNGQEVRQNSHFILATNSYRAHGGGPFAALADRCLIHTDTHPVRTLLAEHVTEIGQVEPAARATWRFEPIEDTSVIIETGPGLRAYPQDIAALGLTDLGLAPSGFINLRMWLSGRADPPNCLTHPCESPISGLSSH